MDLRKLKTGDKVGVDYNNGYRILGKVTDIKNDRLTVNNELTFGFDNVFIPEVRTKNCNYSLVEATMEFIKEVRLEDKIALINVMLESFTIPDSEEDMDEIISFLKKYDHIG